MIDTIYIANYIERELNNNSLNKPFRVWADEGELIQDKTGNLTQGIIRVTGNTLVPIKNINFETINAQLMILVDLDVLGATEEGDYDREQSDNLLEVKQCLGDVIARLNGQTKTEEINGKNYAITVGMSLPTTGDKTLFGHMVDTMPLYLNLSFVFFENGINANDCDIYINGENMYFTRAVISKVKTADNNTFANSKISKGIALVGGKSIDMVIPVLQTKTSQVIMEDILDDTQLNRAVNIRVVTPLKSIEFIGILGNTALNMDAGLNAGYNVSVIQGIENSLVYDSNWTVTTESTATVTKNLTAPGTVYWGDGLSNNLETAGTIQHTYTDGKEKHIVRIFGGV